MLLRIEMRTELNIVQRCCGTELQHRAGQLCTGIYCVRRCVSLLLMHPTYMFYQFKHNIEHSRNLLSWFGWGCLFWCLKGMDDDAEDEDEDDDDDDDGRASSCMMFTTNNS